MPLVMTDPIELNYALHLLPAGRMPFRRWRWELWSGNLLLAAGWRLHPLHAQRAVRVRALRHAHRLLGLHPLHLEDAPDHETVWPGAVPVTIDWGELRVVLTPRALREAPGRLAPAAG